MSEVNWLSVGKLPISDFMHNTNLNRNIFPGNVSEMRYEITIVFIESLVCLL